MVLIHSVCYNTCDLDKAWSADNGNRNGKHLVANCSLGIPSSLWVNTILKIPKKRISCCNLISMEFTNISVWKMAVFDFEELARWKSLCLCRWTTVIPTSLPDQSVPCQGKYIYAFKTPVVPNNPKHMWTKSKSWYHAEQHQKLSSLHKRVNISWWFSF